MFSKKQITKKTGIPSNIKVCATMKDYSNEAYFVKKAAAAKAAIEKWGLPKDLHLR